MTQGSHEPLTIRNRLIDEVFAYILKVLISISKFQCFQRFKKQSSKGSEIPKFQNSLQDDKILVSSFPKMEFKSY